MLDLPAIEISNEIITTAMPALTFNEINSMGASMAPTLGSIMKLAGPDKLFRVTIKPGHTLIKKADGSGFIGATKHLSNQISGQATLTPVSIDPVSMAMTLALHNIDQKLDKIQETQDEILSFLSIKEKAKQIGNLKVLNDLKSNLKYYWNNDTYKSNKHIQVQEIQREAEQSVVFYRELIKKQLSKSNILTTNAQNSKLVEKVTENFKEYHSALYLQSYTSLLEIILLNNTQPEYIQSVRVAITEASYNYRVLYTNAHLLIEKITRSSLESKLLSGFAGVNKMAGKALAKVPVLSKSSVDEKLLENSDKLIQFNNESGDKRLKEFSNHRNVGNTMFLDSLASIQKIYQDDINLIIGEDRIYIE